MARSHWMQMTLDLVYAMVAMVQNSFPLRFKEIHIVNENPYFSMAYNLVSPYLTEKIRKRIQFHGDNFQGTILPKFKQKPKPKIKKNQQKIFQLFNSNPNLTIQRHIKIKAVTIADYCNGTLQQF